MLFLVIYLPKVLENLTTTGTEAWRGGTPSLFFIIKRGYTGCPMKYVR